MQCLSFDQFQINSFGFILPRDQVTPQNINLPPAMLRAKFVAVKKNVRLLYETSAL
jgi:hypothetical protein